MDTAAKPIVATTSLSFLLHGLAMAASFLLFDQVVTRDDGVGSGVEIQLVSSVLVSEQLEAEVPSKQEPIPRLSPENPNQKAGKKVVEDVLASPGGRHAVAVSEKQTHHEGKTDLQNDDRQDQLSLDKDKSSASIAQATNASQQQHSILELLHRRISDNKEYPYLARRHRREGVATVAFRLHPDGTIENAHLVTSSRAVSLDRAAMSAVEHIEPFAAAGEYLEQSEEFQVDIEFDLL